MMIMFQKLRKSRNSPSFCREKDTKFFSLIEFYAGDQTDQKFPGDFRFG